VKVFFLIYMLKGDGRGRGLNVFYKFIMGGGGGWLDLAIFKIKGNHGLLFINFSFSFRMSSLPST
jgi:hypothetical protein